jgi:hypothetical protein
MADAIPSHRTRAVLWLLAVGLVSAVWVGGFADLAAYRARADGPRYFIEHAAALLTGILAVLAAFEFNGMSARRLWIWLPLPALGIWVAAAGTGCFESWLHGVSGDWIEGVECFAFLIAVSTPLALSLLMLLYRTRPRARPRAAAMAGLGVASIAAFLLQFFHPFPVTALDVTVHAAAVALIVGVAAWSPRLVPSV